MTEYPTQMTPELREVLGKMVFQLSPIAHVFRLAGEDIPEKAEAEQAYVLHWLIGLALKHGHDWKAAATDRIRKAKIEFRAAQIYDSLAYDGPGQKPAWMPKGNAAKQDEARALARAEAVAAPQPS